MAVIKFTRLKARQVLQALEETKSIKKASDKVGISPTTLRKWRRLGETDLAAGKDSSYAQFATGMKEFITDAHPSRVSRGPGRCRKLTEEVIKSIEELLGIGMPLVEAAVYLGVHRDTVNQWFNKGREDLEKGLTNLNTRFAEARWRGDAAFVYLVQKRCAEAAEDGNPAHLLKVAQMRRLDAFPSIVQRHDVESKTEISGSLEHRVVKMSDEELEERRAQLSRAIDAAAAINS